MYFVKGVRRVHDVDEVAEALGLRERRRKSALLESARSKAYDQHRMLLSLAFEQGVGRDRGTHANPFDTTSVDELVTRQLLIEKPFQQSPNTLGWSIRVAVEGEDEWKCTVGHPIELQLFFRS